MGTKTIHKYVGRDQFSTYMRDVVGCPGGTISPGGASSMLRVSRQRIHDLLASRKFETWIFYERLKGRAAYIEIKVNDLLAYALHAAKIKGQPFELGFHPYDLEKRLQLLEDGCTVEEVDAYFTN